jgi:hypothetical protein
MQKVGTREGGLDDNFEFVGIHQVNVLRRLPICVPTWAADPRRFAARAPRLQQR